MPDDSTRTLHRAFLLPAVQRVVAISYTVIDGPSRGVAGRLTKGKARVGKAEGCELRLSDPTVSRMHCELVARPGALMIRDLDSKNGTFIDGLRVHHAEASAAVNLRVGASVIRVELGGEEAAVELSPKTELGGMVGSSLAMRRIFAMVERAAPTDSTVLLLGETGTGKDVAARAIHALSRRAAGPFVPFDCGAVPDSLFESELFGHQKGAFTGATSSRRGVFEEAQGGTLFFDELGELPLSLQPKLLRAIESRSVRPVGANRAIPVDVRIVAATNRSLFSCVNEGTFREDLYYRLAVVELTLPPLRERAGDVALLAERFFQEMTGTREPLPVSLASALVARSWPGNVRELRNFVERSISLGPFAAEQPTRPGLDPGAAASLVHLPFKEARAAWVESFEDAYLRALLKSTGHNVSEAARRAGVNRRFLQRTLARVGRPIDDLED
jgi:transcriptional regulator with GAF, ATPase, and Fis domain